MADFKIDVFHHIGESLVGIVLTELADIRAGIRRIERRQAMASAAAERIRTAVAGSRTVADLVLALLKELREDPAVLEQAAADQEATNLLLSEALGQTPPPQAG